MKIHYFCESEDPLWDTSLEGLYKAFGENHVSMIDIDIMKEHLMDYNCYYGAHEGGRYIIVGA